MVEGRVRATRVSPTSCTTPKTARHSSRMQRSGTHAPVVLSTAVTMCTSRAPTLPSTTCSLVECQCICVGEGWADEQWRLMSWPRGCAPAELPAIPDACRGAAARARTWRGLTGTCRIRLPSAAATAGSKMACQSSPAEAEGGQMRVWRGRRGVCVSRTRVRCGRGHGCEEAGGARQRWASGAGGGEGGAPATGTVISLPSRVSHSTWTAVPAVFGGAMVLGEGKEVHRRVGGDRSPAQRERGRRSRACGTLRAETPVWRRTDVDDVQTLDCAHLEGGAGGVGERGQACEVRGVRQGRSAG